MKLAEISIKRPTLVIVLFTILTLGGILGYSSMGYELIPKFEINVVSVSTIYPGASPAEVETTVTKKIEDAVSSLENVKKVESKSFESLSLVTITLNAGADTDYALNDAQRKINAIIADFPKDVKAPSLQKFSLSDLPIITAGATSNLSSVAFYDLLDKKIQPVLSRVKGVAQVNLIGGQEREIKVNLDKNKLEGYGLSIPQVQQAILTSNVDFPTGNVKTRENSTIIRLSGKYKNVEELANLVIAVKDGAQIRLSDVAFVEDAQKDAEKVARIDRKPAILLQVVKQSDANAVEVSELTKQTIEKIEKDYAQQGVKLNVVNDTSTFTLTAADNVTHDLFIAIILVAVVMLLFLHSIRNAFIVMVSIPASLVATFIGMALMGYTLNLMSLLGLSLVVGILVDDAIVVLENIYRHMEMGKNKVRASYDATAEIGMTVTSITLVIVVVFLPIAMSTGLVSNIISQFCVTVVIATLLSLLASFTIVPWLSSRFGKLTHLTGKNIFEKFILGFEKQLDNFTHWVSDLLKWCLKNRWTKISTVVIVIVLFFMSFGLMKFIGGEFFSKIDKGEFLVQIELPKDASVEKTNFMTQKAEDYLSKKSEVVKMITTVGQQSDGFGGAQATAYKSEIDVILVGKDKRADNSFVYAAKVKNELSKVLVGAKIKTVPVGLMGAEQAPLALVVTGPDLKSINEFANQAMAQLKTIKGASEVRLSSEGGNPEINITIDRDKMSALGLNIQDVGLTMQTAFSGNTDGKFRAGDYEYDINIRFNQLNRSSVDDVKSIIFVNGKGEKIKLDQFATITEGSGPSFLERRDKSPSVTINAQTVGIPTGTVAQQWEAQFSKLKRPSGVNYVWSGDMENQSEGFGTLGIALMAAIILVYLVMVALYDSFVYPFVVLFSVPLSLIGVLAILALTNNSLNVFTILGVIMLIGLVCKNAIMLVDFANHRKEAGESTFNALLQANHARLRPILMTTIAMVFGMIPIALAQGAAAELNNGLAWVIIGGLTSSLFLTLIFVPVVYSIFDSIIARFNKGGKVDYAKEMVADYEPLEMSEDGFTPKHNH
ncbi:efflux RND transporter permease subunit [Elizabethkingia miricola]|uniref:efflux RND transporter permease subunit n=1 Tax=Elizabethkingia miricola TaxID=172045 RepID=UPI000B36345B|nr:efflux RND transporter permease subunit [Elizabethkingia miricola]NHQ68030.1 efflux RND transporter permease subunit [Elizabethkingia miricola]NHQ70437.1 efflux RND transporter permease subunit [Elizabethkingia miricola]NHQ77447.1 efflux RND transporter permease subunit [Elizabethkingia miricola]PSL87069.1 AcrB/AcrD/AcrF family protein [Elizabethkingia miricola]QHQ85864.1 efflux RND transporter permease subunit [Elizabethkingia miricola]